MSDQLFEDVLHDLPEARLQSIINALQLLTELPPEDLEAVMRAILASDQDVSPALVARALRDVLAYRVSALAVVEQPRGMLAQFEGVPIRRAWFEGEWHISVVDACAALTGSQRPRKYWDDLKRKLREEGSELSEKIGQLKMQAADGKYYLTDAANREQLLRIIQSIPSPRAEPFKRWLARLGREHLDAQENRVTLPQARLAAYFGQAEVEADDARMFFSDLIASTLAPDLIRRAEKTTGVCLDERVRISPQEFFALLQAIAGLLGGLPPSAK